MEYGLIGQNITNNYAGYAAGWLGVHDYGLTALSPHQLGNYLKTTQFKGLNISEPYKTAAVTFCHTLSDQAREIGSVSIILKSPDGILTGYNCDTNAIEYMVRRAGMDFSGNKVVIYGGGGTGRSAAAAAKVLGAANVVLISRTGEIGFDDIRDHTDATYIINATPRGMFPNNGHSLVNLDLFPGCRGVVETIYNPIRSALLMDAMGRGLPCCDPLDMYAALTIYSARLGGLNFYAEDIPKMRDHLKRKVTNIVLIGMPGSGKTAIGKYISQKLERGFLDMDTVIEQRTGQPVAAIIDRDGEAAFRNLESRAISNVGRQTGKVIVAGPGAVLSESNYPPLKQNGLIFFIDRPDYKPGVKMPAKKSNQLYTSFLPRYRRFADDTIENNSTVANAGDRLLSAFDSMAVL